MNYSKFGDGVLVTVFMFSLCDVLSTNAVFRQCAGSIDAWIMSSYAIILIQNITMRIEAEVSYRLMALRACSSAIMTILLVSSMANAIFGTVTIWEALNETPYCMPSTLTRYFLIAWNLICYTWAVVFGFITILHLGNRWDIDLGFDVSTWQSFVFHESSVCRCTQKDLSLLPKVSLSSYLVHQLKDAEGQRQDHYLHCTPLQQVPPGSTQSVPDVP
eukprot:GEMP01061974.1.p1 GENE.GEMP01061974.1~~GEMP01061974.1.p1  ORF type:complete len:217 (+),score=23.65 GEMP01061974.1:363-1013(+)